MATQYDLTAPGVWESIYDENFDAAQPAPGRYTAIPRRDLPILLEESVIAIGTSSSTAPPHWRYAGRLVQRAHIPGVSTGLVDGIERKCKLNIITLAIFPLVVPQYRLAYEFPPWITNLSLSLWRYTGKETDNLYELVETLKVDVARVENKLDQQSPNNPIFADRLPNDLDNAP
jgi:hypothetical protein